ncbi:RepB family plasmid replication initiator protein [Pseudoalteromonas sp. SR45-4]|uniref:RepB family plasmid replication initiator protein n=1 Tax=Pseudoalteromonas sp. SR45-4 TaxID=2760929 RepID=UPI0015FA253E|nr:RepB family plasmid replication initiator protein [Pseudoalteromonas sp. SR45-4]MBB1371233.1 RepB family plasmid replication initiator protein [Pseudoalteromonas sp. SR45-4]
MQQLSTQEQNKVYLRQSNMLTTAAYNLSRNEKRLVYLALDQVMNGKVEEVRGRFDITISHKEYALQFNEPYKNISRDISKASCSLNKKEVVFYIPSEDGDDGEKALDGLGWTIKRSVRPKQGVTVLGFNAELVDIMKDLTKYTGFFFHNVAKINSAYTMRLYESLRQWVTIKQSGQTEGKKSTGRSAKTNSVTFSVDWLIMRYQLPDSYNRMSDFRRRFLIPAVNEITEKTDIELTYIENTSKAGRKNKVTSITFYWKEKNKRASAGLKAEDTSSVTSPPVITDIFNTENEELQGVLEKCLVYIDKFTEECELPTESWCLHFIQLFSVVRKETAPEALINKLKKIPRAEDSDVNDD